MSVKVYIFIMAKFTDEQRLEIIKTYYRNSESVVATLRALTPIFGRNNRPTRQAVRAMVNKFESTYSLLNIPVPVRQRTGRSIENIAAVRASVQNEPNQSIPRRSQELGICQTTLWRILLKDLHLHPYKIKLTQELKPLDHLRRRNFSDFVLQKFEENPEFHQKLIFSDEAHFWLNGFVNKQNMRYWTATNPHVLHETPLHPQKVSVWCGFYAGDVIGPYFFVDENNRHVTVNGVRYRAMLEEYFWPELDGFDISDM
ncbi:PREDICTED: uncharacterized protein LOC107188711 [Dufourea novaeangliae]|uniref:uncharacterized protein LOC107188711 n=1 Tax=Dufourea novaeangliae TaxID=178035 RepID=UPI000766EA8C|nr:PREDICTED: uncharacterized protein LOC107188711 [Dufourea novaeangliae]